MGFKVSMLQPEPVKTRPESTEGAGEPVHDLAIIGAGPAGLTAAVYASRGGYQPIIFTGNVPGGQISSTEKVENFPGFPEGINGADLADRMYEQAEHFGATFVERGVESVNFSGHPLELKTSSAVYRARAVIIATGAFPRRLGVPGESEFFGRGVSTCATCDGFFYKGRRVVVVGGGDSALEEGLFLTRFASEIIVLHRRDQLRASNILQERAFATPSMRFVWDTVVEQILGEKTVTGVRVRNVKTEKLSTIETDGVFVYVGLIPATKIFQGQLEMNDKGYPIFRQAVIAAGSGAAIAMEAGRQLAEQAAMAKKGQQPGP